MTLERSDHPRGALLRVTTLVALVALALTLSGVGLTGPQAPPAAALAASGAAVGDVASTVSAADGPALTYRLPFPAGTAALVTQGNAGPFTHKRRGFSEFAWDFALPSGSMVCAAAAGTVVRIEERYAGGGMEDSYRTRSNYVVLSHPDGYYSVYMHLTYRGSLVSVGEQVRAGQGIALSGATGYASGPHLHFQVQESETVGRSPSVPVSFADAGVPELGDSPVSGNLFLPPEPAPRAADPGFAYPGLPAPPTALFTHQTLTVSVDRAAPDQAVTPSAAVQVPIRIVVADGEGRHTVKTSSTVALQDHIEARLVAAPPGPVAAWAEYRDGTRWVVLGTASGGLVHLTTEALAHDLFLEAPGLVVEETAPGRYEATFTVVNLGSEAHLVRDLTITPSASPPTAAPSASTPPVIETAYLRPGGTRTWRGDVTLDTPGRHTLTPTALDAAGDPLRFPAVRVGMPETVTLTIEGEEPPPAVQTFVDVPHDHPAFDAVELLVARGLVGGYPRSDGSRLFKPDAPVTRAQFAKLLVSALALPVTEDDVCPFVDVEVSGPLELFPDNYIAVAAAAGITKGTAVDPPRFSPYAPVTRSQALTMAGRAVPHVAVTMAGDPQAPATRAEAAQLVALLVD